MAEKEIKMLKGSVQLRLSVIIVLITTLILSGYTAFDYLLRKKVMMTEIRDRVALGSARMGKALADPIWNIDKKAIEDINGFNFH